MTKTYLAALLAFLLPLILFAQNTKPILAPAPAWVQNYPVAYDAVHLDDEASDGYSNLSYEKQISLEQKTVYRKIVSHIITEGGVQNNSEISIVFDPSYQQLLIHTVIIMRNGATINKLKTGHFKTYQKEEERNRFIYDGSLTAVMVLDDVRRGDIIEYSYSIKGFNPVLNGKFSEDFDLQYSTPIYQLCYRVLVPAGKTIYFKNSNTALQPRVEKTVQGSMYEWKQTDVKALNLPDKMPEWYNPWPLVMVSEFASWKEVVDWALPLYQQEDKANEAVLKKAAEIKAANANKEDQVLAALHFVQDNIRYLGIELGENSHKPHVPSQVLAQRFGDCKDKAYLLCTLLHALDIEAYPVLINTTGGEAIKEWLPTPYDFDHVTVCAVVNNKKYWFDGTIAYQRGRLRDISFPEYKMGLVIAPNTTALSSISQPVENSVSIVEQFDAIRNDGKAKLWVQSIYKGSAADDIRYESQTSSHSEFLQKYKEFYAVYFPKIQADSIVFLDNKDGSFTSLEYYTIPGFWMYKNGRLDVDVEPYIITTMAKKPKDNSRTVPFSLAYPVNYHEVVRIKMPDNWHVYEREESVVSNAFNFKMRINTTADNTTVFTYDYVHKKDHVLPEEMDGYVAAINEMDQKTDIMFSQDENFVADRSISTSVTKGPKPSLVLLMFGVICVGIIATIKIMSRR